MKSHSPKIRSVTSPCDLIIWRAGLAQNPVDRSSGEGAKRWPTKAVCCQNSRRQIINTRVTSEPVMDRPSTSTGAPLFPPQRPGERFWKSAAQGNPLDTTRVRVESRSLSIPRGTEERAYEIDQLADCHVRMPTDWRNHELAEMPRDLSHPENRESSDLKQSKPEAEE
jgi:hypothetical protein